MDFISLTILLVFIPTFFLVSITPGMCMMLALSMGISIGFKNTLNMMYGELIGVGLVATLSAIGVATIMVQYPFIFIIVKYAGGLYLIYLGVQMYLSKGKMSFDLNSNNFDRSNKSLAIQGFVTAIANPKGWAFFIALLPPFLDKNLPLTSQLVALISLILIIEFICLIIYASSGNLVRKFLQNSSNLKFLNKIAGSMMIGIGVWLAVS